ncbi:hypothetical protein RRG08_038620 [Elysia crispata]|uniref:Uncharacterized protein n=1 Tax=Elysia crispata TaxID=231223 RepID=A0AAE0YKI5_9GAST|nr:hypothetical protein RRG08_038620 [Elysia crispata]
MLYRNLQPSVLSLPALPSSSPSFSPFRSQTNTPKKSTRDEFNPGPQVPWSGPDIYLAQVVSPCHPASA